MSRKAELKIAVRNEIQPGNTLELFFLDDIYDYLDWDNWVWVSLVQDVINRVRAAKPSKIIAWIHSQGGSADIGLAIYNFLRFYGDAEVESRMLGMAGSIASVIPQAASKGKRFIARNGFMVIHKAWGVGVGNGNELRQAADIIDGYTAQICDIYSQVSGRPAQEFMDLIEPGDYWMTGQEAVDLGLADAVFDDTPEGFEVAACVQVLDERYQRVPDALKNLLTNPGAPDANTNQPMDFKTIMASFKNSLGKKKINAGAENLAEEVANVMAGPLQELLEGMQTQVQDEISNKVTEAQNALQGKITEVETANKTLEGNYTTLKGAHDTLQTKHTELQAAHDLLLAETQNKAGGESNGNGGGNTPGPIAFGSFAPVGATISKDKE